MNRMMRKGMVAAAVVLGGCATSGRAAPSAEPEPRTAEASAVPEIPKENPCANPEYLALRSQRQEALDETQLRTLADMENACIDYRLAVARARSGSSDKFPRDGADYRGEVFPWVAGISLFTGVLYLFTYQ